MRHEGYGKTRRVLQGRGSSARKSSTAISRPVHAVRARSARHQDGEHGRRDRSGVRPLAERCMVAETESRLDPIEVEVARSGGGSSRRNTKLDGAGGRRRGPAGSATPTAASWPASPATSSLELYGRLRLQEKLARRAECSGGHENRLGGRRVAHNLQRGRSGELRGAGARGCISVVQVMAALTTFERPVIGSLVITR